MDKHSEDAGARGWSVDALLAEGDWMEGLAGRLVGEAGAKDLVQEAFVVALARPPRGVVSLRRWLAVVLRRLGRDGRAAEGNRRARERAVARREELPSGVELVERAEWRREVAQAVLGLSEPYRGVVLLRYFEGFDSAEIARRSGVPASTVRSQIRRGLGMLREELDRRSGGARSRWLSALAGWGAVGGTGWLGAVAAGVLAMKVWIGGAAAVGIVFLMALIWQGTAFRGATPPGGEGKPPQAAERGELSVELGTAEPTRTPAETVVRTEGAPAAAGIGAAALGAGLVARVLGPDGRPMVDGWSVIVELQGDGRGMSKRVDGASGEARFDALEAGSYGVSAHHSLRIAPLPRWIEVAEGALERVDFLHEPGGRIEVRVERSTFFGAPPPEGAFVLRGAEAELRSRMPDSAGLHVQHFDGLAEESFTVALEDERFEPWGAEGVRPGDSLRAVLRSRSALRLEVLAAEDGRELEEYELRAEYPKLRLQLDGTLRLSGKSGTFPRLAGAPAPPDGWYGFTAGEWTLRVGAPGRTTADVPLVLEPGERRTLRVDLAMGARLAGRVLAADGTPWVGIQVQLLGEGEAVRRYDQPMPKLVPRGMPGSKLLRASTDGDGRFGFTGLEAGPWTLLALVNDHHSARLDGILLGPAEEREVELALPATAVLRGRVFGAPEVNPAGHGPEALALFVEPGGSTDPRLDPIRIEIAPDGSFQSGSLPIGPVKLSVGIASAPLRPDGRGPRHDRPLFELLPEEGRFLELDLSEHWPGSIRCVIEGGAGYDALVRVPGEPIAARRERPNPQGIVRFGPLLPGTYELAAFQRRGNGVCVLPGAVHLGPGKFPEARLTVREYPGTLTLLDSSTGEALAERNAWIIPVGGGGPMMAGWPTDTEGRVTLSLPPGSYRVGVGDSMVSDPRSTVALEWTSSGPQPERVMLVPEERRLR